MDFEELEILLRDAKNACNNKERLEILAKMLAWLGEINDTPHARKQWINQFGEV